MTYKNMVSGELMRDFPRNKSYNSDSHERALGLWRYAPGGIIEKGWYEYKEKCIGPYHFDEKWGYIPEYYYNYSTPPFNLLVKKMVDNKDALAVLFVNNLSICTVYPTSLKYEDLQGNPEQVRELDDDVIKPANMVNIGWVRTYVMCGNAALLPYRLQMSLDTGKAYLGDGKWVTLEGFPLISDEINYPQYKRLLENQTANAVYYNCLKNEEVFI